MTLSDTMTAPLRLEPELTIYSAAQTRVLLAAALAANPALVIDLGQVCEIDSAGVQLLLAARRTGQANLAWPSNAVREAFTLLGLGKELP